MFDARGDARGDKITTIEASARRDLTPVQALRQTRRLPVRLLHAGPGLLGGSGARGDQRPEIPATRPPTSPPSRELTDAEIRER